MSGTKSILSGTKIILSGKKDVALVTLTRELVMEHLGHLQSWHLSSTMESGHSDLMLIKKFVIRLSFGIAYG